MDYRYRVKYRYEYDDPEHESPKCNAYVVVSTENKSADAMIACIQWFKDRMRNLIWPKNSHPIGETITGIDALPLIEYPEDPDSNPKLNALKDFYIKAEGDMDDIIKSALIDGTDLTDGEIQYLLEWTGDNYFAGPEDIREDVEHAIEMVAEKG